MDRRIYLHVQGGRAVSGVLRGFDIFLNLVLDQAHEEQGGGQRRPCGMIVSACFFFAINHAEIGGYEKKERNGKGGTGAA